MYTLLVADDEADIRNSLKAILEDEGYACTVAKNGQEALDLILRQDVDLVLADLRMPGLDGHELLGALSRTRPDLPVVILTAFGSVSAAVDAMKHGAADFLAKPVDVDLLLLRVREILAAVEANRELARIRRTRPPSDTLDVVHGTSPAWQHVLRLIAAAAASPSVVLITGESGTGKEIVAREIHQCSERSSEPFVAVNCGALPVGLAEAELFGAIRGAYTGADRDREGLLRLARGGTLLLDEIGELEPAIQAKLLRAIEERSVRPIGGSHPLPLRCRFVAATNLNLARKVEAGSFRQDLYFRLAVLTISVPPLRERREDIPALVAHLLHRRSLELRRSVPVVMPEALAALMSADLPGNVRELDNILQRALMICRSDRIGVDALPGNLGMGDAARKTAPTFGLRQAVRGFEAAYIRQVLYEVAGNRKLAAERLGISLTTLYQRLHDLGID
jgi:DNA-binding NtrC family response regulator